MMHRVTDPVERIVALALDAAGIKYWHDSDSKSEGEGTDGLDFYLIDSGVYVECKRFHSPRISEQCSRVPDIIVIQGMAAANLFANMLQGKTSESKEP